MGLLDIRGGEKLDGLLFGGAKDGRFLGLGLRVGCGDDKGAAADATAVDMVDGDNDSSSSGYGITTQMSASPKYFSQCIDLINLHGMQGHLECGKGPESGSKRGIGQVDISKESRECHRMERRGRLGVRRQCDSPELQAREMDENLEGGGVSSSLGPGTP